MEEIPVFTNDAVVFGLLMISLGFVFYTSSIKTGFWAKCIPESIILGLKFGLVPLDLPKKHLVGKNWKMLIPENTTPLANLVAGEFGFFESTKLIM